jgi:DNA mismatch repair protein MutL
MAKIAELPQHLVNKIAAGEVVDRPASVVKELLENSLDAGATRITVDIEDGGKKLIRISDNGSGIPLVELPLAFAPHATSKILKEEDLFAITTMGFRGEALASIASISQVEIISRPTEAIEGGRLEVSGGQRAEPLPAPSAVGTVISVRNLFFNTPARRKFLRAANTEMGHITEQFTRIALANPEVHLILTHNGRKVHELPAGQSLRERIGILFSHQLAQDLIPIERTDREVRITGLIAPPRHARSGSQWQYVFLNGRHIRDRFISHAVRESFRGLLEANRQPVAFLFIQLACNAVDVNVHPAKTEVRFSNSNAVHSLVLAALRDRLLSTDLSVPLSDQALQHGSASPASPDRTVRTHGQEDLAMSPVRGTNESKEERQQRVRQAMADFFKGAPPPSSSRPIESHRPSYPTHTSPVRSHGPADLALPPDQEALAKPPEARTTTEAERRREIPASEPEPPHHYLQVHNAYLVTETENGILIIDQHALHERVIYEQLHRQVSQGALACQRRLIPETLEVTAKQMAALDNAADILKELGILTEPFGPRTIAIQGFPSLLDKVQPAAFLADLLDVLISQSGNVSKEQLLHELLDMMACKAAVKAGDALTDEEIKSLLAQRNLVERSSNCPHGRPTTIRLSLDQLERQFKRT